jgi:hypothetical protein
LKDVLSSHPPARDFLVVAQFESALKGHGFSRAVTAAKSIAAFAAAGMLLSN